MKGDSRRVDAAAKRGRNQLRPVSARHFIRICRTTHLRYFPFSRLKVLELPGQVEVVEQGGGPSTGAKPRPVSVNSPKSGNRSRVTTSNCRRGACR